MAYTLGQLNKDFSFYKTTETCPYMNTTLSGEAKRMRYNLDWQVTPLEFSEMAASPFLDECFCLTTGAFEEGQPYRFSGLIKRLKEDQVFYIRLLNKSNYGNADSGSVQYLKTIRVAPSTDVKHEDWVSVNFMFTPMTNEYDTILFYLVRRAEEYTEQHRYPGIIYLEVSPIKNILGTGNLITPSNLMKMGIQSRPGLEMCINKEEIKIGRTGIYEVKNGQIYIDYLSIVNGYDVEGNEYSAGLLEDRKSTVNQILNFWEYSDIDSNFQSCELNSKIYVKDATATNKNTKATLKTDLNTMDNNVDSNGISNNPPISSSFVTEIANWNATKNGDLYRKFDAFTIDYMYSNTTTDSSETNP